ncbi:MULTISPECIES: flagellar motor protein MotB [unclassified Sphingomonas]|uniref:flagellar motor protein MotB n=1 Tax=unclassified Sphingomonas TaxID=196159 RepID=UPI002151DB9A|nr:MULTISPECIES: flagellar motor protein MotB [unclassified Sphingomonas]MCR5869325.1 OmpA family protein [Sphingomonas sp. J344]UUX98943.1 OmpA family protein [Sphingomonas sp. J315]
MASYAPNTRPIVIRKVKKVVGGHHGGAWKVAYADFVTAMMAFFMLLWLISTPEKEKLKGLAEYFSPGPPMVGSAGSAAGGAQSGSGGHGRARNADQAKAAGVPAMEAQSIGTARGGTATIPDATMRVLAQELRISLDAIASDESAQQKIESDEDGLRITLMDSVRQPMFRPGTAQLNDFARRQLGAVADKLVKSGARLTIEGHTDGAGGDNEANWRLSGERALAARTVLLGGGITADRIAGVMARGASQPIYPGEPGRAENRRITIIVKGESPATPADSSFKL